MDVFLYVNFPTIELLFIPFSNIKLSSFGHNIVKHIFFSILILSPFFTMCIFILFFLANFIISSISFVFSTCFPIIKFFTFKFSIISFIPPIMV